MEYVLNERTGVWHLLGARGCGVDPAGEAYGEVREGSWATVRDDVDRSEHGRCSRCRWPPR